MNRSTKDTLMGRNKKLTFLNDNIHIVDEENFEPPQLSSTPSKIILNSKITFKDNNRSNISIINNKEDRKKKENEEIDNQKCKTISPIVGKKFKYNQVPELFSDPKESVEIDNSASVNDSDDEWITFSDISENKSYNNVSGLLTEIEVESRFEKPPRRSYVGRKRNNTSLYQDENEKENENIEMKTEKTNRKPKKKKYTDPQDEALILSMNEHFNDVESFSLIVE